MQNCHGRTVLDFLLDYWTLSNVMVKFSPKGERQRFYLVLNSTGEYIHLLLKPVLNARTLWSFQVHVQLSTTGAVSVDDLKLLHSLKANSCVFWQLCPNAIGSVYFLVQCWRTLACNVIVMQFTVVMIPRFFVIYHLHNMTIQRRIPTVIGIQTYHVLCQKHQASAVINWEKRTQPWRI